MSSPADSDPLPPPPPPHPHVPTPLPPANPPLLRRALTHATIYESCREEVRVEAICLPMPDFSCHRKQTHRTPARFTLCGVRASCFVRSACSLRGKSSCSQGRATLLLSCRQEYWAPPLVEYSDGRIGYLPPTLPSRILAPLVQYSDGRIGYPPPTLPSRILPPPWWSILAAGWVILLLLHCRQEYGFCGLA